MEFKKTQTKPEEAVLVFSGKLDFMVRRELQVALQSIQSEGIKHVVLDLTDVSFVDCAALGILVKTKHELDESQVTLSLIATPGRVFDILHAMNLDKIMPITAPIKTT